MKKIIEKKARAYVLALQNNIRPLFEVGDFDGAEALLTKLVGFDCTLADVKTLMEWK
jgi:hypothetical protein